VYSIYCIRYLMVLVYVIYAISVECTISYREISFLMNRISTDSCLIQL